MGNNGLMAGGIRIVLMAFALVVAAWPAAALDRGATASPRALAAGKRVALVIGNGAYRTNRLDNPARDARLIADTLSDLDFDTELVIDAGKSVLETAIVRLGERLEKAGSEAIGFFYFAGHGIQHLAVNYLVPIDTQIPDTRYLKSGAVPVDYLVEELARARTRACVVVLDACRDSAVRDTGGGLTQGLASIQNLPDGTMVVFSTAAGQVADDGQGDHSPYARALARHLTEPDRRLEEVFFAVSRAVAEATGNAQRPALFVQGAVPAVVLKPGPAGSPEPLAPVLAALPPEPAGSATPAEARGLAEAPPAAPERIAAPPVVAAPAPVRPVPLHGPAPAVPAARRTKAPAYMLAGLVAAAAATSGAYLFWPPPQAPRVDLAAPATWPVPDGGAVLWRKAADRACENGASLVLDGRYCLKSAQPVGAIWEAGHATVPLAAAMLLRGSARSQARCDGSSLFEAERHCLSPAEAPWMDAASLAASAPRPVIGGPLAGAARLEPRGTPACAAPQVQFPFASYCLTGSGSFGTVAPTLLGHERLGGTDPGPAVDLSAYRRIGDCPAANTVLENAQICLVMPVW